MSGTIYLIEDEEPILNVLKRFFESYQENQQLSFSELCTATTAVEGLEKIMRHAEPPQLIVTDNRTPDMTGIELIAALRNPEQYATRITKEGLQQPYNTGWQTTPIILLTGTPADIAHAHRLGLKWNVKQPFELTGGGRLDDNTYLLLKPPKMPHVLDAYTALTTEKNRAVTQRH